MEGKRLIEKIRLRNILSFGDKGEEIELLPLNIIIGQNASGKSNLVDIIKMLNWLPKEKGIINYIGQNGGIKEWIWKGKIENENYRKLQKLFPEFELEITLMPFTEKITYLIAVGDIANKTHIVSEKVGIVSKEFVKRSSFVEHYDEFTRNESLEGEDSILTLQGITKENEYALKTLILSFTKIQFFTDVSTNRESEIRRPQQTDAISGELANDASNLFIVLNNIGFQDNTKPKIIEYLKKFNPKITDYSFQILGGFIQLYVREEDLEKPISVMRLSDGTLRYLCLLAILCHPEPPPLICIEEPETGLHPDILPTIAELMLEASQRTQLIVTTHSDILVSAFSEIPEAVLVCEKDEDGTHFKRLEAEKLKVWLEEYTLGEAWLRGAIGGTRW